MSDAFSSSPWDIVGEYILHADPAKARQAVHSMANEVDKGTREMSRALANSMNPDLSANTRKFWSRRYGQLARGLNAERKQWDRYWEFIEKSETQRRNEQLRRDDRSDTTRHKRQQSRNAEHQKRLTASQVAADRDSLRAKQAADRAKATADRRATQAEKHEQHKREIQQRRNSTILAKTVASFYSNLRTTNETGQRAIVNMFQAHWRRIHNDRRHAQSMELADVKRHGDRTEAALRDTVRDQRVIVTRGLVAQQGAVATAQQQLQRGVVGGFLNMRNVLLGGGVFLGAREIFGNLQEFEQTQIAFTNILDSGTEAQALLLELQQFNVETPFDLPSITSAAKQLLAMGETSAEIVPDLQAIGDVGAKFAASSDDVRGVVRALGQMSKTTRVTAQDINQIQQRFVGFDARAAIARGAGISVAEAMEQIADGSITGAEGMNFMIEGMRLEENAAGAMAEQMESLTGRLSNFGDMIYGLQIEFLGPFIDEMAEAVNQVTIFIDSLFRGEGIFTIIRSGLLGVGAALSLLLARDALGILKTGLIALGSHPVILAMTALGAGISIIVRDFPHLLDPFREFAEMVEQFAIDKLESITEFWHGIVPILQEVAGLLAPILQNLGALLGTVFDQLLNADFSKAFDTLKKGLPQIGEALGDVAVKIGSTLQPVFDAIKGVFVSAFDAVVGFFASGGVDRLVAGFLDMMGKVVSELRTRVADIFRSDFMVPLVAGLGVLLAHSVLGIGFAPIILAALAAGFLAISPQTREVIVDFFSNIWGNISDWFTDELPLLFIGGMYALGNFLGGPVVSTILSEGVMKAVLAVGAVLAAGGLAWMLGLVEGLKDGLPNAVNALQQVFDDLITGAMDGLFNAMGPLAQVFQLLAIPLRGILPALELFVDLISLLPSPVLLAGAAIGALVVHLVKVQKLFKETGKTGGLVSLYNFMVRLPAATRAAGVSMVNFGTQVDNGLKVVPRPLAGVGQAAQATGTAVKGVASAMSSIGPAALIGIPVALGLWENAKAKAEAWKQQVRALGQELDNNSAAITDFITDQALSNIDGYAEALAELGMTSSQFAQQATGGTQAIGEMFAAIGSDELRQTLDDAGISMEEFGAAAAEGDRAVQALGQRFVETDADAVRLGGMFKDIPEGLRQVVDQSNEAAESYLEQAIAAGDLTEEQVRLFAAIQAGEAPTESMIVLAQEAAGASEEQAEALNTARDAVDRLSENLSTATTDTQTFRDALDEVTGSAIEIGRARESVQGTFDTITEGIESGKGLGELSGDFLSAAEGAIGMFETLSDAGKPKQAAAEYERLRSRLMEQYTQLGLNQTQAEEFTDALIPPVDEIAGAMDEAQQRIVDGLRRQRRNLLRAIREGTLRGEGLRAAQDMVGEIEATIASYEPSTIQMTARVNFEEVRWDATVAQYERMFAEGEVDVGIRVTGPQRPTGPFDRLNFAGFTGPAGAGASQLSEANVEALDETAQKMAEILRGLSAIFERFFVDTTSGFEDMGREINQDTQRAMTRMVEIGKAGATAFVRVVTTVLRGGTTQVGAIVSGYARTLANSLNPLLTAIGSEPVTVGGNAGAAVAAFAEGGIPGPRIAGPSDGPVVHVYNEGRSGRGSAFGEAYIPFDPTHRSRAKSIADRTVGKLGGHVQWFEGGGYTGGFPNLTGDVVGLNSEFARRLSMFGTRVGTPFHVGSGYRSIAEQVVLYNKYLAGTGNLAAPPGSSLHNYGLAADGPHWGGKSPSIERLVYDVPGEAWHVEPVEGRGLADGAFSSISPIAQPPSAGERGLLSKAAAAVMNYVYEKVLSYAGSISYDNSMDIGGSAASRAQAAAWIRQSMRLTNSPSSWLTPLMARAWQESGFNPRAINLWDSNAAAGHPSKGLFQMIDSTFLAHMLPGYPNIWNPIDNGASAIRYMISRYGSPFNLPSGGYANGGIVTRPQVARLAEDGPEIVLPLNRKGRLETLLRAIGLGSLASKGSGPARKIDLNLTIDGSGDVDPALYDELAGAVRSGVAEGMYRAEAIEGRW